MQLRFDREAGAARIANRDQFRAAVRAEYFMSEVLAAAEAMSGPRIDNDYAAVIVAAGKATVFDPAADPAADDDVRKDRQRPTKILAVEDNPGDAALLRYALDEVKDGQFELIQADSLSEALRRLGETPFDIVLLDLSLPDGRGIDTLLRLQMQAADTPVIVLTGLDDDRIANAAVGVGAQDYLVKGEFDGRLLFRSIRYAMQRKHAQDAQARYHDQAALNAIATAVSDSWQLDEFLEIMLEKVLEVTGCEMAHVRLRNPVTGEMPLAAHRGLAPEHVDHLLQERRRPGKLDQVFHTGEAIVGRTTNPERIKNAGHRLTVWTPLKAKNKVVGVLNVSTLRRESFSAREVELLKAIGNVIGVGLENSRLYTETRRHLRQVEALRDITVAGASSLNLSRVLNVLLEKISTIVPYSAMAIRLHDKASGQLKPAASWNLDNAEWMASTGQGGVARLAFEQRSPLAIRQFVNDSRTRRPEIFRRQGLVSYLGVPMLANGDGIGVLSIYTKFEHEFPADEIKFLAALANQAGMAIRNSQLYEQLSAQAAELARSNKVKDEFLSVMSHEFRTPLNVIMGYSELLRDGTLGAITQPQESAIGKIADRSKDLLGLLTSVLEVTRLETDTVVLVNEVFDLSSVLDEAKSAVPATLPKDVAIRWLAPPQPLRIHTDRRKLRHVIDQLVSNAMQFTEAGTITVSVSHDPGAATCSLSVADSGVGIPAEAHALIFQKFYQLDSSTTRSYGGIGLGLYVAKRFVELMGGTISLQSAPGMGSTFIVTLPVKCREQSSSAGSPEGLRS